jgi:predicted dinucleotide-binding enzyme
MQLGIIGAGNVGKALAAGWLKAGHSVIFGVRDPAAGGGEPAGGGYASVADDARKPLVPSLVSELGFQAVDAGPLRTAHLLEPMAMLWIYMALVRGGPRSQAFALTQRAEG